MSFVHRQEKAQALVSLFIQHYWDTEEITQSYGLVHELYGYETHISQPTQEVLKQIRSSTSRHIRFTPDVIIASKIRSPSDRVILVDYKVMTTPRYKLGNNQWDQGQVEADAWDNYMSLWSVGVKVALLIYCAYHSRPILCDWPQKDVITLERTKVQVTGKGSGTDYCNIKLTSFRTFDKFIEDTFGVPQDVSQRLLRNLLAEAKQNPLLHISHDRRSPDKNRQTGFNWEMEYET